MPNRDGTGPYGGGRGFFRGLGFGGRGAGRGMGRGMGRGLGLCGRGLFSGEADVLSEKEELLLLSRNLSSRLEAVRTRLAEIDGAQ